MRLFAIVLLLWVSLVSIAQADVLPDGFPRQPRSYPPRPRPRYPVDVPPPVVVPVTEDDEGWHPNTEIDPEATPEEAGFVIIMMAIAFGVLSVRNHRRETA